MSDFNIDKPEINDSTYEAFLFLVGAFDLLEKRKQNRDGKVGSVLVFLPGIYEIEEAYSRLKQRASQ